MSYIKNAVLIKFATIAALALAAQAPTPTDANLGQWLAYIRPKAEELVFEQCDWKPTFWEGVVEAQKSSKPILLWAMNGHPMACT